MPSPTVRFLATILTTALLSACSTATARRALSDEAADRAALLRLHEQHRTAHFDRRADLLVASQADSLVSVSGGRISTSSREAVRASFQEYFDKSTFQAWDDVTPPRIRISADGQMAYVIVDKRVHTTSTTPGAAPVVERVHYAWLSVYEKRNGEWRMTAIASTDRPDST